MNINCHYCETANEESDIHCGMCRRRLVKDLSGKHTPGPVQMNGHLPVFQDGKLFNGLTQVAVFRKDVDERTGRERIFKVHEGVVIQQTSKFARVFNPLAPNLSDPDKGGDISAEMSQMFPIKSPRMWVEVLGRQAKPMAIPAVFR